MPAKKKKRQKPKIKVEEIVEEPKEVEEEVEEKVEEKAVMVDEKSEEDKPEEKVKVDEKSKKAQPEEKAEGEASNENDSADKSAKLTSFSQLDTMKSDSSVKIEDEKSKTEKSETLVPDKLTAEDESSEKESEEKKEEKGDENKNDTGRESKMSSDEVKKWLKEVRPDTTKEVSKDGGPNLKILVLMVVVFLVLGALVGGVLYYKQGVADGPEPTMVETGDATETPVPTEVPEELDLTTYSISILNGSGVAGVAGSFKDILGKDGFDEGKVEVANADSSDYTKTTVSLKADSPEGLFETLKKSLKGEREVARSETELEDDSTFDAIITIGSASEE